MLTFATLFSGIEGWGLGAEAARGGEGVTTAFATARIAVHQGDALTVLRTMPAASIDSCACGCGARVKGRYQRPGGNGWRTQRYVSPAHALRVHRRSGGWDGASHTPEARANISAARRRFYADHPEAILSGARNPMYGRTGTLNPNYRSGSTPERQRVYATTAGRAWRRAVVRRDRFMCRLCESKSTLHAHHIRYWSDVPELRLVVSNGITLCADCHRSVHSGRKEVPSVG